MNNERYYEFADELAPDDSVSILSEFLEQDARRFVRAFLDEQEASVK
ncbi:MAG: hypothetical protein KBS62_03220 [Oscillospiraceae bacterium]|nr:hypothetical protein [Candidatus Ruminococcus equi]